MPFELPYAAAILWSWVGVWALSVLRSFVPPDFFRFLDDFKKRQMRRWSLFYEFDVPEYSEAASNDLYRAVHLYLSSRALNADAEFLIAERPKNATKLHFELGRNQFVTDDYRGNKMKWERRVAEKDGDRSEPEKKSYRLVVYRDAKGLVREYFNFLLEEGKQLENQLGNMRLYSNLNGTYWASAVFNPPATFSTVAMDPEVKKHLIDDLTKFMNGEKFYKAVGRAWKRGYLLHGPPGTGKSSLIAAIANFTGYDVYDLELTKVSNNTQLRELLSRMKNRVIVVVEDIDCTIDFQNRKPKPKPKPDEIGDNPKGDKTNVECGITLSGLLNFTDGLWSSTGSERIFVFTTNYVEKLDPALLRPGRMDVHICMSYCSLPVFKDLASNYLGLEGEDELLPEIERLLKVVDVTPAQVIEMMLRFESGKDSALKNVVAALQQLSNKAIESQVSIAEHEVPAFEDGASSGSGSD